MTPTAPHSRNTTNGMTTIMLEDDTLKLYKYIGIPKAEVNNWVKARRPIVCPLDTEGGRVRLKVSKVKLAPDN